MKRLLAAARRFWLLATCPHSESHCTHIVSPQGMVHWHVCKACLQVTAYEQEAVDKLLLGKGRPVGYYPGMRPETLN